MMYHLHIADKQLSSWSLRAWILLRQANIPFIETVHSYHADLLAQRQQWRSFSPTSKVPVLLDGETLVWESLAIADYVAEDYPQLWPANRVARAWARSATAEMHAGFAALRTACNFRLDETNAPVIDDDLRADLFRLNELWQEGIRRFGGPFLAGTDFGVVDAFYVPMAVRLQSYQLLDCLEGVAARDYAQCLLALPALQQWRQEAMAHPVTEGHL